MKVYNAIKGLNKVAGVSAPGVVLCKINSL